MRTVLDFLWKHNHWLLFIALEIISLVLLFTFNSYQGSVYFSSASRVAGTFFQEVNKASAFFSLGESNQTLAEQNARLTEKVLALQQQLAEKELSGMSDSVKWIDQLSNGYRVQPALVVSNSVNHTNNFLTLNKGTADGVEVDQGVFGSEGIVGVVFRASKHYALVLSVLNSKSSISCKLLHNDYYGYLRWGGGDSQYALLMDLPRYSSVQVGDTVVTSGYSTFFPMGIPVGRVEEVTASTDGLSITLKVKLATNFGTIQHVFVVSGNEAQEVRNLNEQQKEKVK